MVEAPDPSVLHTVRVHAAVPGGLLSMPLEFAFPGKHTRMARGTFECSTIHEQKREGVGLSLLRGETSDVDGEFVLDRQGAYVRGGGVQLLGDGEACYLATTEVPTAGRCPA